MFLNSYKIYLTDYLTELLRVPTCALVVDDDSNSLLRLPKDQIHPAKLSRTWLLSPVSFLVEADYSLVPRNLRTIRALPVDNFSLSCSSSFNFPFLRSFPSSPPRLPLKFCSVVFLCFLGGGRSSTNSPLLSVLVTPSMSHIIYISVMVTYVLISFII